MGFGFFDNSSATTIKPTKEDVRLKVVAPVNKSLASLEKAVAVNQNPFNVKAQEVFTNLSQNLTRTLETSAQKIATSAMGPEEKRDILSAEADTVGFKF